MQITGEPKQRELTSGEFGAYVDQEITIHGAIHSIRMMSDFAFVIIRTARETVQCVYAESFSDYRLAQNVVENASVKVTGLVVAGADKEGNVRYELQIHNIEVLSVPAELPPVVINKESRIPTSYVKLLYRLLPFVSLRVGTHPNREITRISRAENQQCVTLDPCCRSAKVFTRSIWGHKASPYKIPITEILAPPISALICRKQVIVILIHQDNRIGSGAMLSVSANSKTISIINIDWITISFLLRCTRQKNRGSANKLHK